MSFEPRLDDFVKELVARLESYNNGWAFALAAEVQRALVVANTKALERRRLLTTHSEKGDVR